MGEWLRGDEGHAGPESLLCFRGEAEKVITLGQCVWLRRDRLRGELRAALAAENWRRADRLADELAGVERLLGYWRNLRKISLDRCTLPSRMMAASSEAQCASAA